VNAANHEPAEQCPRCGTWVSADDFDARESCPGCSLSLSAFAGGSA
jgi:hypothetical protein